MKIKLSPVQIDEQLIASVSGDTITVNGVTLDFSPLPEGASLPSSAIDNPWIINDPLSDDGDIYRENGEIHLTLRLPFGSTAPHATRFPTAYDVPMTVVDGQVPLPPYDVPPADDVQLPEIEPEVVP